MEVSLLEKRIEEKATQHTNDALASIRKRIEADSLLRRIEVPWKKGSVLLVWLLEHHFDDAAEILNLRQLEKKLHDEFLREETDGILAGIATIRDYLND